MAETAINIPQRSFADITEVILNADRLTQIVTLSNSTSLKLDISSIAKEVIAVTQISDVSVRRILSALANFRSLMERSGLTTESLIERLTESLASQAPIKWKDQYFDQWQASSSSVASALNSMSLDHPIVMLQKVQELAYTHEKVFQDASIYTDLRPVFNVAGDKIRAAVLTNVLTLNFQDGENRQRISLTLDLEDLVLLRKMCERAELKTRTAQKELGVTIPLIIPGSGT